MKYLLSIDEAFAMAIQIESNAAGFYRRAAGLQGDAEPAAALERLAVMEDEHKRFFGEMRLAVRDRPRPPDPGGLDPEGALFLSAIGAGYLVEGSAVVAAGLTGRETLSEILRKAIELEKQSVLFYLGLRDVLSDDPQQTALLRIIGEEKKHLVALTGRLRALESAQ